MSGSKHLRLTRPERLESDHLGSFERLRHSSLKTARAWRRNDMADRLWNFLDVATAKPAWKQWLRNARRCKQKPLTRVANMVANHLDSIAVAAATGVTNAIYFRSDGLSMYL